MEGSTFINFFLSPDPAAVFLCHNYLSQRDKLAKITPTKVLI